MDQELDRTLNVWDEQSCREFEAFLDEWADDRHEYEPACECFYVDVDVVESRWCPAHGRKK